MELFIKRKGGETSWTALKDIKVGEAVITAEYDVTNKITEHTDFAWWVSDTLRKCNKIISEVKARYWNCIRKFGIRIPKNVDEAY